MDLVDRLRARGVLALPMDPFRVRMVTHHEIGDADVERAIATVDRLLA